MVRDPDIEVYVDPETKYYRLPKDLLCNGSTYSRLVSLAYSLNSYAKLDP